MDDVVHATTAVGRPRLLIEQRIASGWVLYARDSARLGFLNQYEFETGMVHRRQPWRTRESVGCVSSRRSGRGRASRLGLCLGGQWRDAVSRGYVDELANGERWRCGDAGGATAGGSRRRGRSFWPGGRVGIDHWRTPGRSHLARCLSGSGSLGCDCVVRRRDLHVDLSNVVRHTSRLQ